MTFIDVSIKRNNLVLLGDVTQHILPFNSAVEGLINYYIF